jgi:hypothetical protein
MHLYLHFATSSLFTNSAYDQSRYAANTGPLYHEPEAVAANFPEPNVRPYSPAFLQSLVERKSWMTYNTPNFTSEEGRSIPYVWLSNTEGFNGTSSNKLRIYIHGVVHGNQPAGDQAVMASKEVSTPTPLGQRGYSQKPTSSSSHATTLTASPTSSAGSPQASTLTATTSNSPANKRSTSKP